MEKQSGEKLAKQLNLGEVTSWRLHWLTCEVSNLLEKMKKDNFYKAASNLSAGETVASYVEQLKAITVGYARLRHETRMMLHLDYTFEDQPLFEYLGESHTRYLDTLKEAKDYLQHKTQQILEAEGKRIAGQLEEMGKYL